MTGARVISCTTGILPVFQSLNCANTGKMPVLRLLSHGLAGGDLDEEFFEGRVLEADFAQRPAVLDDGAGDLLADVVGLLGADGGGDVSAVALAVAGDDVDLA